MPCLPPRAASGRLVALVALLFPLGFPVAASAKRPVTHEDIFLAKRLGSSALSSDGKWLAVSVTEPAYDEKKQTSDVWLVATDGSAPPRQVTFTKEPESGLTWSPQGQRLAFSTKRENDEVSQIYLLDMAAGGEARRVTSLSSGARSPQWRPDGQALLFVSSVYPGALDDAANQKIATDRKNQKAKVRVYEGFPVRYWDKWLDDQQAHLFVQPLEPGAAAKDLLAGTELVKKRGFGGSMGETGENLDAAWTPDGTAVVFSATTERDRIAYSEATTQLFLVPATGGEPTALTSGKINYTAPEFTPDGKHLLVKAEVNNGELYNLSRLNRFAWPALGQPVAVAADLDVSVGGIAVSPDSDTVYFTADEKGYGRIFAVSLSGAFPPRALPQQGGSYSSLLVAGEAASPLLVAEHNTAIQASDAFRLDPVNGAKTALTTFNAKQLAELDVAPLQEFWFTAKNGKRIHNLVALPPGYDPAKKYPLVTLVHGGPHSMSRDGYGLRWPPQLIAAGGMIVVQTNYTGSTGFGEKFAQSIKGDPFRGPASEILEAIDEAIRLYPAIDANRVGAAGASYGGHMMNWFLGNSTRFKALVSHAGLANLEAQWGTSDSIYHRERSAGGPPWEKAPVWSDQNPIRYAAAFKTPILVTVGEKDFRVPVNNTLELWSALQRQQVPSKLLVFPDENHWIRNGENSRYHLSEVVGWLQRWL